MGRSWPSDLSGEPPSRAGSVRASSVARRVLAAYALLVLAFVLTVSVGLAAQRQVLEDVRTLSLGYVPVETALARLQSTAGTVAARLDRLLDDPRAAGTSKEWLETVARGRPAVLAAARTTAATQLGRATDIETRAFGLELSRELGALDAEWGQASTVLPELFAAIEAGQGRAEVPLRTLVARESLARRHLDEILRRVADRREAVVREGAERNARANVLSIGLAVLSLAIAILATRDVQQRLAPLARLTARAKAIASGDRSVAGLPETTGLGAGAPGLRDEIGELAIAFRAMVEGVAERDADLSRLRQRQEDIVNHLRAAVVVVGPGGQVESANAAALRMLEVRHGVVLRDVCAPLWSLVEGDVVAALQDSHEPQPHMGVVLTPTPGQEPCVVDIRVMPMRSTEGALALIVVDDVSEAAAARARALQAERLAAIGKMAAHITHEIRNPLSSIGLNVELLDETLAQARGPEEIDEGRRLLSAIAREVRRLSDVSEDYLRVARLPSPRLATTDLGDLLREVVDFARPELDRARILLKLELSPAPILAAFDEAQVRQALLNLIRNAREAMPEGGPLTLRLRTQADRAQLEIEDRGPGIPEEVRARIFDPFFTTKATGTGLGLPLTRQVIHAHGGTIDCRSVDPQGTCFTVELPLAHATSPEPPPVVGLRV